MVWYYRVIPLSTRPKWFAQVTPKVATPANLLTFIFAGESTDWGMTRTIDFLRHKEIPIMGLVMMDGYRCPHCGKVSHQLLSPKLAMEKVARNCGVPFLISIPQTTAVGLLAVLLVSTWISQRNNA